MHFELIVWSSCGLDLRDSRLKTNASETLSIIIVNHVSLSFVHFHSQLSSTSSVLSTQHYP
jgi:hypothetical protein